MAQTQNQRRFFRFPEVKQASGLGRTAIYAKIKTGEFPAPYPLSNDGRAVGWLSDEIDAWISSRITANSSEVAPCAPVVSGGKA